MIKHLSFFCLWLLLLISLSSCERDPLYYASAEMAEVNVQIDWSQSGYTPNGATVYAYRQDGSLYRRFPPFSNPRGEKITLPFGRYKLVVINDTPDELSETITISGEDNVNTLLASGVTDEVRTAKLMARLTRTTEEKCILSPDTLVTGIFSDLVIDEKTQQYYTERPTNQGIFPYNGEVKITPQRVTTPFKIKVHVKGLKYAKGTTMSFLRGTSGGYYLGQGTYNEQSVAYGFILNNRTLDAGSSTDGTITATFNIFDLCPTGTADEKKYYLDINFVLVNGEEYPMTFDITDQIDVSLDADVQLSLKLDLDITLPEAIDSGSGGFSTDLNEWTDIIQNIQM